MLQISCEREVQPVSHRPQIELEWQAGGAPYSRRRWRRQSARVGAFPRRYGWSGASAATILRNVLGLSPIDHIDIECETRGPEQIGGATADENKLDLEATRSW